MFLVVWSDAAAFVQSKAALDPSQNGSMYFFKGWESGRKRFLLAWRAYCRSNFIVAGNVDAHLDCAHRQDGTFVRAMPTMYILYTFTVSRGLRRKGSLPFLTFRILYSWPNSDMYVWLCAFYNPFLAAFLASRSRYICGQKRLNCAINRLFWRSGGAHLAQSTFRPLTTGH